MVEGVRYRGPMAILWRWVFLMSEVPLYLELRRVGDRALSARLMHQDVGFRGVPRT